MKSLLTPLAILISGSLWAQAVVEIDTVITKQLEEVIITATRSERTMGALPMPVSLVLKSQIKAMGSLRLNDVLAEQTGLIVVPQVNAQGNGLQLQGFNPDYTLILIDGEPIIGRYTGSLELSRIAVGNIKQIEIVKGPSSSLYGSDALAGVVNIITEKPTGAQGNLSARYGTNNALDINGDYGMSGKKIGVYAFVNRYHTDGYDLSPQSYGKTVSPFTNYTFNAKLTARLTPKTELILSGRHFAQEQIFGFEVESNGNFIRTAGNGVIQDWSFNPVITHRFSEKLKATARFYSTHYQTDTKLTLESDGTLFYTDNFNQTFSRPEINAEYFVNDKNILTLGSGFIAETVQTSRYGDQEKRRQQTAYGFFQHEWSPLQNWTVIGGGRFDVNSIYGGQFSPKLSSRFELSKRLSFKLSGGVGFKSPDFRQLYFNFNNSAAGGYSVLGTEIAVERLAQLEAEGQIQTYIFDPALLGNLKAERSVSINAGANAALSSKVTADVNLFYNSINNLIETQAVATTTGGQSIYSYRNILRAFTQGMETNISYALIKNVSLSMGYQLLFAKDKDVAEAVKAGEVYWRDPNTLVTRRLKDDEYFGLYNRSRHMGNIKLFYQNKEKGWGATARVIYRGKYGIGDIRGSIQGETIPPSDRNSNSILDKYDDFIDGYPLLNLSVSKTINQILRFQVGVDNVFNHTEPVYIPNLPGRLFYTSVSYSFSKKNVQP
jgi:outer membrane receptor for ferrienterochelin and colicins